MIKINEFIGLESIEDLRSERATTSRALLLLAVLFFFQPVIAVLVLTVFCLLLTRSSLLLLCVLVAILSMYLGLLNLMKHPESDMVVYLQWLERARELGFIEFMAISPKEPGFCLYMYLVANVLRSSDGLFIFVSTVLPYAIFLMALARLGNRLNLPAYALVSALIFFAFFPALFNNSAHLMRQFLAGALVAWFYIDYTLGRKNPWWILLLAISVHTTALIFIPLALAGSIRRFSQGKLLTLTLLFLSSILILVKFAGTYLTAIPYLGDIIQRAISGVYIEHAPLGIAPLLLLFFVTAFSTYKLFVGIRYRQKVTSEVAYNLYISSLFLSLFIWWAHITGETMLATRLLLYVYFLSGPILLLALAEAPGKKTFSAIALLAMPVYFIYTVLNGVWTYEGDGIWVSFAGLIYGIYS